MAKYLKLFMVALFATLTLSLTACGGDDDDEPQIGGGNGGGNYTFNANGKTYYYGIPFGFWDQYSIGYFSIEDNYYTLSVRGYDRQLTMDESLDLRNAYESNPFTNIDLFITVNPFDLNKAKSGDPISIHRTQTSQGYDVVSPLEFWKDPTDNYMFYWGQTPQGQISFVSFKDEVLTVNFKNCIFVPVLSSNDLDDLREANVPEKFTINGNVSFDLH